MLFTNKSLEGIAAGRVTVAFRRWKTARVKAGTRLRTAIGLVEVVGVDEVVPSDIHPSDVVAAGFADRAGLDAWLDDRPGRLFRVELRHAGPDPRVALRNDDDLDDAAADKILASMARMDRVADRSWTVSTLELIASRPGEVSTRLAAEFGVPRDLFKRRVRRLKELGLTESLKVGYRLSPRGRAVLERAAAR